MSEAYSSWSTADHASSLSPLARHPSLLGAAAGGHALPPPSSSSPLLPSCPTKKRSSRSVDVSALIEGPLALPRLGGGAGAGGIGGVEGEGEDQASRLLSLLLEAGFRAVHQSSPPGVAVFLDSQQPADLDSLPKEKALLWLMLALDPSYADHAEQYLSCERRPLLCRSFASRLSSLRPNGSFSHLLAPLAQAQPRSEEELGGLIERTISTLAGPMGSSALQLEREWDRLSSVHSTLANACLHRFCQVTGLRLQESSHPDLIPTHTMTPT